MFARRSRAASDPTRNARHPESVSGTPGQEKGDLNEKEKMTVTGGWAAENLQKNVPDQNRPVSDSTRI